MDPLQIVLALGALLAIATLIGLLWQRGQGRVSRAARSAVVADVPRDFLAAGAAFTLLQFSGPFCSYCEAMRRILSDAAHAHPGMVAHREVDITDHPELTARLSISQTPTTLIVSDSGHIISRIRGAAKPPVVQAEIANAIEQRKAASDEYLI
jgi:thiol-disulfide isomerase/thioredoxin